MFCNVGKNLASYNFGTLLVHNNSVNLFICLKYVVCLLSQLIDICQSENENCC